MGALMLITAMSLLSWWLDRTARNVAQYDTKRHGPVRLRDGRRASKAAQAAAAADRCVWCDEQVDGAGPHCRTVTRRRGDQ